MELMVVIRIAYNVIRFEFEIKINSVFEEKQYTNDLIKSRFLVV